ncbi:hypothetical protein NKG05_08270 [Oerskovia sp. M15]
MIVGTFVASTVIGQLITRTGRYKAFMVTGGVFLVGSLFALSTIDYQTSFVLISVYLFFLGASMGMLMQNLVLAVQNTLDVSEMGAAPRPSPSSARSAARSACRSSARSSRAGSRPPSRTASPGWAPRPTPRAAPCPT